VSEMKEKEMKHCLHISQHRPWAYVWIPKCRFYTLDLIVTFGHRVPPGGLAVENVTRLSLGWDRPRWQGSLNGAMEEWLHGLTLPTYFIITVEG
jgi:hypothetical protein